MSRDFDSNPGISDKLSRDWVDLSRLASMYGPQRLCNAVEN